MKRWKREKDRHMYPDSFGCVTAALEHWTNLGARAAEGEELYDFLRYLQSTYEITVEIFDAYSAVPVVSEVL